MAEILHRLGYVRKGHLIAVTRDDLVGQYIGHTAPKTREVLKRAMGGVLFIDEAYYLYRPENERDYGQEAIEILLQVMENQRDDLVVILAGYKDRMETFFRSNPGMSSRIAHHIEFPGLHGGGAGRDRAADAAADAVSAERAGGRGACGSTSRSGRAQPHFANARSISNALDRARLRQASRLFERKGGTIQRQDARDHRRTADITGESSVWICRMRLEGATTMTTGNHHQIPHRGAAAAQCRGGRQRAGRKLHRARQRRASGVQANCDAHRQGRVGQRAGRCGRDQCPGRDADEARRACQRDFRAHQRVGRSARGDAVGGAGAAIPHTRGPIRAGVICCFSIRSTAHRTSTSTFRSAASSPY